MREQKLLKGFIMISLIFFSAGLFSQSGGVSISSQGNEPHESAGLDVNFDNKGFLPPRLSTSQRNAISDPAEGLVIYNTDSECIDYRINGLWLSLCGQDLCSEVSISASNGGPYCVENTIELSAESPQGESPFSFSWSGPNDFDSDQQNPEISDATTAMAGTYTVTMTDANFCIDTASTTVAVINEAPSAPEADEHTTSETQIVWNWTEVMGAEGYKWNTDNNYSTATDIGEAQLTQEGLECETEYILYVWAYNECGEAPTLELNASTDDCTTEWTCGELLSYEGHDYTTVQIGVQCWFAENLRYDNGCTNVTWANNIDEGWCGCYNNQSTNCDTYGLLYQWSAAMDGSTTEGAQGLCPQGWHVPTDEELKILEGYVDTQFGIGEAVWDGTGWRGNDAGTRLKADTWDGNNESAFAALPGGRRHNAGSFFNIGSVGFWWSSSQAFGSNSWERILESSNSGVLRQGEQRASAFSVRCLRN